MKNENPIQNILVAIDGSDHSLSAVKLLSDLHFKSLSSRHKCLITALGVLPPREASNHVVYMIPLKQSQKILQDKGYKVETELILGYPAEVITNYADSHSTDLVVVGAKGLRATLGILLGGVAQQIVEYALCPVLVVRAPYNGIHKVLLVTDGSESSQKATQFLTHFPFYKNVKIYIAHVLSPTPQLKTENVLRTWEISYESIQDYPDSSEENFNAQLELEEENGRNILKQSTQILDSCNRSSTSVLLRGDAATEIIEYSKKFSIDMIIAGSRGLSQMQSWLLGSVSRKLVHYAPCSILLVKNPSKLQ
jgi:nucleotide-binding universal stress UspA family protein